MKAGFGTVGASLRERALKLLEQHPRGLHSATLLDLLGDGADASHAASLGAALLDLTRAKRAVWVHDPAPKQKAWNRRRFFAFRHAPALYGPATMRSSRTGPAEKPGSMKLDASLAATGAVEPVPCPAGKDHRFTVESLPPDYRSQLSAAECRPWAAVVAR